MDKGYSVVVTSTESGGTRYFFISKKWLKIIAASVFAVVIILGYIVINYSRVYYQALETVILKRRNVEIEKEFAKLQEIKENLERTEMHNKKLQVMLGIEQTPSEVEPDLDTVSYDYSTKMEMISTNEGNVPSLLPTTGRISRSFSPEHNGIDIAAARFSPVVSAASGIVKVAGWDSIYGNYIVIDHTVNYSTFYGHLNSIDVSANDRVTGGKVIGTIGSTGKSTSPHLHYEVRFNQKAVDPVGYLPFLLNFKENL
jgi:murein DD-endopeptidase MepM/ murein hydrolase activator NlpD